MRLKRIRVSNAKQYHDVDLDLSQVHLASIIGYYTFNRSKSNGAGKSTLGDLIMFALFETVPDKSLAVGNLVSWGATEMSVDLEFEYESNHFLVKRGHNPSAKTKNTMELEVNGVPQGKDILERRRMLSEYLGVNDQIAQATWFFQQSESNKLTSADPKDRKDYLAAVLDADKYDRAHLYAKEKCGDVEREIEKARQAASQIDDLNAQTITADEQVQSFKSNKAEHQTIIDGHRQSLEDLNSKLAVIASQRNQAENEQSLNAKLVQVRTDLANSTKMKEEAEGQLAEHHIEVEHASKALESLEHEKAKADADSASIIEKWKGLGYTDKFAVEVNKYVWEYKLKTGASAKRIEEIRQEIAGVATLEMQCPTCGQLVDDNCRAKLTSAMQLQIAAIESQSKADITQLESMYKNEELARDDDRLLNQANSFLRSYESSKLSLESKVKSATVVGQSIRQQSAMLDDQISRANASIEEIEAKIVEAKKLASTDDSALNADKNNLLRLVAAEQKYIESVTVNEAKWQNHSEALRSQLGELEQVASDLQSLEEELKIRQTVMQLFHRDGLPLSKINSACSLIEAYANSMMSTVLPNYHLKVEVESGKRGKLDFMVNTPGGLQPYAVMSGGEKAIAGLCLRMALSRILAEGSGHRFETLFLDEVFAQLDQVYRPVMMNLVKELSKTFKSIYVISHELEIQTAFPQVVLVECDGKESRVKLLENNEVE